MDSSADMIEAVRKRLPGIRFDIDDIAHVVNYEVPRGLDAYVHRVGRTGRYDAKGHALTLADPSERRDLEQIERVFGLRLRG